jgi:Ser/Thr protein kinase RdoA (MazF antagonist)
MHWAKRVRTCFFAGMTYLKDLIEALRGELQQYGEMLARLDDAAVNSDLDAAEDAPLWAKPLQEQAGLIELALCRREQTKRQVARDLRLPEEAVLPDIIPSLPRHYQLLITALMDENKALSARIQQRANQSATCRSLCLI